MLREFLNEVEPNDSNELTVGNSRAGHSKFFFNVVLIRLQSAHNSCSMHMFAFIYNLSSTCDVDVLSFEFPHFIVLKTLSLSLKTRLLL